MSSDSDSCVDFSHSSLSLFSSIFISEDATVTAAAATTNGNEKL